MPKEKIYGDNNGIEIQWSTNGQHVCIVINEQVETHTIDAHGNVTETRDQTVMAMWQAIDPTEIDRLITALQRARRKAFPQTD